MNQRESWDGRPMNALELMYVKSSIFLRDVFHYLVPGVLFVFLLLLGLSLDGRCWSQWLNRAFESSFVVGLFLVTILAYAAGHILLITADIILDCFRRLRGSNKNRMANNYKQKEDYLKSRFDSLDTDKKRLSIFNDADRHLYYEMRAFSDTPELHARFVERYNVLMHMRKSLSSCFLLTSLFYLLIYITAKEKAGFIIVMAVVLFVLFIILLWRAAITRSHFLNRVYVSYLIAEENKDARKKGE